MIPLKDDNPTSTRPVVTLVLIGLCIAVYFLVQPVGRTTFTGNVNANNVDDLRFTLEHAAVPDEVTTGEPQSILEVNDELGPAAVQACEIPAGVTQMTAEEASRTACRPGKNVYLAILWSMFLHGNLLHIFGNMLFLWVFGNNIEDRMGKVWFAVFYLVGGFVAAMAHILVQPHSGIPVVGASGAIAAVMGAYLVLFPKAPINTLLILGFIILFRKLPAWLLLVAWLVLQFFTNPNEGVAWVAHVGGFVFGVAVAFLFQSRLKPPPRPQAAWTY